MCKLVLQNVQLDIEIMQKLITHYKIKRRDLIWKGLKVKDIPEVVFDIGILGPGLSRRSQL